MYSAIFEGKPIVTLNGVRIVDFKKRSIDQRLSTYEETLIIGEIIIDDEYEMRPDSISNYFYGSPYFFDIILKANGISNPFAIYKGMVLKIPELSTYTQRLSTIEVSNEDYLLPERLDLATIFSEKRRFDNTSDIKKYVEQKIQVSQ